MGEIKPPMDGTEFYGISVQPYRWHPYSPKSEQFRRGLKGRWQAMGEYGGWDNAKPPAHWVADDIDVARLIAAAPELLEAAREIDRLLLVILSAVNFADKPHLETVGAAIKSNRAAIAKATGQAEAQP